MNFEKCLSAIILLLSVSHLVTAQKYQKTEVTPHLNVLIRESENIVYTSSFHIAWKMLENDVLRNKVKVGQNIPLVAFLNDSDPADINAQYSVNLSGFVKNGIINRINDELYRKFGRTVDFSMFADLPSNIICYSYFDKKIRFKSKFETFDQPLPFFSGGRLYEVKYFGVWTVNGSLEHRGIKDLVKVYDRELNDFIIAISNPGENDEIIIGAVTPSRTLNETVQKMMERINNSEPGPLVSNDRLVIPLVTIKTNHEYGELYGVHLVNAGFESYFFAEAVHDINFELNETGAFADSEAKVVLKKGPGPRTMMINRPFLIMMREKSADIPYFAAWISNPELLVQP